MPGTRDQSSTSQVFNSETQRREKDARVIARFDQGFQNVTRFKRKDNFVIGQCAAGLFLLNTNANSIETWGDRAEWEKAVTSRTGMTTDDMVSPKASSVQSWDATTYWALVIVMLILTPWALAPLWTKRNRANPRAVLDGVQS